MYILCVILNKTIYEHKLSVKMCRIETVFTSIKIKNSIFCVLKVNNSLFKKHLKLKKLSNSKHLMFHTLSTGVRQFFTISLVLLNALNRKTLLRLPFLLRSL